MRKAVQAILATRPFALSRASLSSLAISTTMLCYFAITTVGLCSLALPALAAADLDKEAPDFSLSDADGKTVKLSDYRGKKVVVVYFYPKDDMGVCKEEACSFRDKYEEFKSAGAEVIGINSDSVSSHKKFVEHRKLPFILVSDPKAQVRKEWGVPTFLRVMPARVTFVVDKGGIVRFKFNSLMEGDKHVNDALKVVNDLSGKDSKQAGSQTK